MDIEVVLLNRIRTETVPRAKSKDYIIRIRKYRSEAQIGQKTVVYEYHRLPYYFLWTEVQIGQITAVYEAGQPHQPT